MCLLWRLASCKPVVRPCWVHTYELFFTLSHTLPLHESHLNTRFLNAELQVNWHGIKPTKCLIKFNLTYSSNIFCIINSLNYERRKESKQNIVCVEIGVLLSAIYIGEFRTTTSLLVFFLKKNHNLRLVLVQFYNKLLVLVANQCYAWEYTYFVT